MGQKRGFSIFRKDVGCAVQVRRDEHGVPFTFSTREEAEREIARGVVSRIFHHFDQRSGGEIADALTVRDYILEVEVLENGTVIDPGGNQFGRQS